MFSNHNGMKLELNDRRTFGKFTNMWKLNTTFISNQWVIVEITREIRNFLVVNEKLNTLYSNL